MPPFLAAILSGAAASTLANVATAAAPRLRAAFALRAVRRPLGAERYRTRRAPQVPPPRVTLTAPLSYGPPVPSRPTSVDGFAARLAGR